MPNPISEILMARAIELSKNGFPAPNPHVGCVIEKNGEIVGEGFHNHAGGPHAEINALAQAGHRSNGATVYTTQEPCNSLGRTGPCSEALIEAGVARVVSAVSDPNPKMTGGNQRLRQAGIEVIESVLQAEAEKANLPWLTSVRRGTPYVVGKSGISMDGRTALASGESKWITGSRARTQAHILRAECGAVLVGTRTVEIDDPELTVRHVVAPNQPLRIVIDRHHKLNSYKVFDDQAPFLRVTESAVGPTDLEVNFNGKDIDLSDLLTKLFQRGITSFLIEGGAYTLSTFLEAKLIDRLELFMAPKILGNGPSWVNGEFGPLDSLADWRFEEAKSLDRDLWITAYPGS